MGFLLLLLYVILYDIVYEMHETLIRFPTEMLCIWCRVLHMLVLADWMRMYDWIMDVSLCMHIFVK